MDAVVRRPDEFESRLRQFVRERSEESRAVRVGEKDTSEQAVIVARYADLFTRVQLDALRSDEEAEEGSDERERLHRLRRTCEAGLIASSVAPLQDALTNAELAARVEFAGERIPLRTAMAQLATQPGYADREELGKAAMDVTAGLNERRLELVRTGERLQAELSGQPDPIARAEQEKEISLRELEARLADAGALASATYEKLRRTWLDRLLGKDRAPRPSSYHAAFVNRLSSLADVYSKERATDVCLATLRELGFDLAAQRNIRTDLEDRPQKAPRAVVIAADPPSLVYLITRPRGGLQDYQSLLHEAGHALHFAGCDPALPYAFRVLSRDHALTEIYSYVVQAITREPEWHVRHFRLSDEQAAENAEAGLFLDVFLFRRYLAKLQFELEFWSRFHKDSGTPEGYAERLTEATGFMYRSDRYLADTDAGFYSADYLRAWIRSAQLRSFLRREVGDEWWRRGETGDFLRGLFREGLRPSNEDIAGRIGFAPLDVQPLVAEQTAGAHDAPGS